MGQFAGKIILVTGASSGIGEATAIRLAEDGATVILAARRVEKGQAIVERIRKAGGNAWFVATDLTDPASIDSLFGVIAGEFTRLDAAINNAGLWVPKSPLEETPQDVFDRVFATNVRGTWLCLRHEMRMMKAQGNGAIVNVASILGLIGSAQSSVYVASKHAVIGMTKSAALEVAAEGIRINCLAPGAVQTEMTPIFAAQLPGGEETMAKSIPMKRIGTAEELAANAAWLISDQASYITGAVIVADGGLSVP